MVKKKSLDLDKIYTYSLGERESIVDVSSFASPIKKAGSIADLFNSLPRILAGEDLRELVERIIAAHNRGANIIVSMGAHVIKVGLAPVLIQLMEAGIISGLAVNGACLIHDVEIAFAGATSEDVAAQLKDGKFGMARETSEFINSAFKEWEPDDMGFGNFLGSRLKAANSPYLEYSLLAGAHRLSVPVTAHVAPGTDIIHMHPLADGEALGRVALHDFRVFASWVAALNFGVYINIGSAVLMPEIFLKALSLARNLGYEVNSITTASMDFIQQYRARQNIVVRPTMEGGKGYYFIGHHEIMVPLLAAAILQRMED